MGQARTLIREPMERWGLHDMIPVTELLVSELVTNALRYSPGTVTLCVVTVAPSEFFSRGSQARPAASHSRASSMACSGSMSQAW